MHFLKSCLYFVSGRRVFASRNCTIRCASRSVKMRRLFSGHPGRRPARQYRPLTRRVFEESEMIACRKCTIRCASWVGEDPQVVRWPSSLMIPPVNTEGMKGTCPNWRIWPRVKVPTPLPRSISQYVQLFCSHSSHRPPPLSNLKVSSPASLHYWLFFIYFIHQIPINYIVNWVITWLTGLEFGLSFRAERFSFHIRLFVQWLRSDILLCCKYINCAPLDSLGDDLHWAGNDQVSSGRWSGDDRAIHVGRVNISSLAFTFFLPFKRQTILQMVGIFKPHSVLKM